MPNNRIARRTLPFVVASLTIALAGCAGGSTAASSVSPSGAHTGKPEMTDIVIGTFPTPDYAPVQIAIDKGYFKAEGLSVTTQRLNPSAGLGPLLNQSFQIQGLNWVQFVTSVDQNVPIVGIAALDVGTPHYAEIMVKADSPYKSLADLNGKKVGVVSTPGNCDLIPLDLLAKKNETAKPNFVNLGIPDMPGQLARGGVDAACVPEPTLSALNAQGGFRSIDDLFSGAYEGFPVTGISASKAFVDKNPNTVAALQRAIGKARRDAASDDTLVRQALKEYTQIPPAAIDKMVLPKYVDTMTAKDLQQVVDVVKGSGLNPKATLPKGVLQIG